MYKFIILAAVAAVAQAGLISSYSTPLAYGGVVSPAIGASSQSTLRSLDGSSAISQYSKAVDTAFSSVRKTDTRITNDARYLSPVAYAAPAVAHAPVAYAAAPAYAAHAPVAYAAPAYAAHGPVVAAGPVAARAGLLGVAYSAAPAVAHVTYDSPLAHYVL